MARPFISRLLETFFRRKWLYLLPLVPFIALGVLTVVRTGPTYRSTGLVRVDLNTTVDRINQTDNALSGETAATFTASDITTQLQIEDFLHNLMGTAGIEVNDANDAAVRRSVWAEPVADNLVTINAATSDRTTSLALAQATIDTYVAQRIAEVSDDSDKAVTFFQQQANDANEKYIAAQKALQEYSAPYTGLTETLAQNVQAEIGRLTAEVANAQENYNAALGKVTEAQQAKTEAVTNIPQQFRVKDPPREAEAPEPRRKQDVMTIGLFTILGLLVSGAALVVGTLMDRSVRFSDEIETHLDVPVVATIPDSRAAIRPRIL